MGWDGMEMRWGKLGCSLWLGLGRAKTGGIFFSFLERWMDGWMDVM